MKADFQTELELIVRFESGAIEPGEFHHADHVRLAYAYLRQHPLCQALANFSAALKKFAAAQGKAERYHETITTAYFLLINERLERTEAVNWEGFARCNPDLICENNILHRYYRENTLASELAKRVFVFPDKWI